MEMAMAASSVLQALVGALHVIPCQAVPATIDALLLASSTPPTSLLHSLLHNSSQLLDNSPLLNDYPGEKDGFLKGFMSAVVHLFKVADNSKELLSIFVWSVCIPLLQQLRALTVTSCNIIAQALADVLSSEFARSYAEESLFPYLQKSIDHILQRDRGPISSSQSEISNSGGLAFTYDSRLLSHESLALHDVCRVLAMLFLNASHEFDMNGSNEEFSSLKLFCTSMIVRFLSPIFQVLSQTSNDAERRSAINIFLPPALNAIDKLKDAIPGECVGPLQKQFWDNLRSLFVCGSLQRQDAYSALDVCIGFLLLPYNCEHSGEMEAGIYGFNIFNDMEFWNVIKSGLVDSDPLTRKRALHILREASAVGSHCQSQISQSQMKQKCISSSFSGSLTKRASYASLEARSLGVGDCELENWKVFFLLYDMLEEYGTHLVEAVWKHQLSVLLPALCEQNHKVQASSESLHIEKCHLEGLHSSIWWISVLWERGFAHDNPQVRRLILQSFMELEWANVLNLAHVIPESFVLGALVSALNDPIHHKDFGLKGIYSSEMAKAAAKFFSVYSISLGAWERLNVLIKLAKVSCAKPLCRPGFMTSMICLEAVADPCQNSMYACDGESISADTIINISECDAMQSVELLNFLGLLVEESKNHFNPKYRYKACHYLLQVASSCVALSNLSYKKFFWFLGLFPWELIGSTGMLHKYVWVWLKSTSKGAEYVTFNIQAWMTEGLLEIATTFIKPAANRADTMSDEDVQAWIQEADKWARMLSLGFLETKNISTLMMYIEGHASEIYQRAYNTNCVAEKLLLLLARITRMFSFPSGKVKFSDMSFQEIEEQSDVASRVSSIDIIKSHLHSILLANLDEFLAHARRVSSVFWNYELPLSASIPTAVIGNLGGPSKRRLPSNVASDAIKGVIAVTAVADFIIWICESRCSPVANSAIAYVWEFAWKAVTLKDAKDEVEGELQLSIHEALVSVLKALSFSLSPSKLSDVNQTFTFSEIPENMNLEFLTWRFMESVNRLLNGHVLARSRQAVLSAHKWCCLDILLSISRWRVVCTENSEQHDACALSDAILKAILLDTVNSLESAGDDNMLPILRCVRWIGHWGVLRLLGASEALNESQKGLEVVWSMVRAAWAAIADSNKRRVASIAAFLSALIHPNIFNVVEMHENSGGAGPLKWLICKLLDQGSRSPRTMRLTAMHLAGLWLKFPAITKYYIEELKLLSLHGGENIDEELDGQISENTEAFQEYMCLMQSLDPELVEEFRNSEQYVRITTAVLLFKLAEIAERAQSHEDLEKRQGALCASLCGKKLLLSLLNSLAYDKELSKELYKKKSAIHRRKLRAWQVMCILSRFVKEQMVGEIMDLLQICLLKNNLPSVRQYAEIFGVQLCVRFPYLIKERIISSLKDYNMKTQAQASYVFISVNVLLHAAPQSVQNELLEEVMPAVVPYLTTHHHPLRSFSQILLHEVLHNFLKLSHDSENEKARAECILEKKCFSSLVSYLDGNADCRRIRVSVEKFLRSFNPEKAATPRGIFSLHNGGEEDPSKPLDDIPFECAPISLMDQVCLFLNEAREDLRHAMAADAQVLQAEDMNCHRKVAEEACRESKFIMDSSSNFQKKMESLRFSEAHCSESEQKSSDYSVALQKLWELSAFEKENELLLATMHGRIEDLAKMRGNRQEIIVVASLMSRIPNLAGLVRTCEVFKASTLVLADATVVQDKQFQLISVTAEMWVPIKEVAEANLRDFLALKMKEGYTLVGLEQTANSISLENYKFQKKTVLVLGKEKEGIPVNILHLLDACVEIPQLGVIRSLNVHVSGAIALWEYTRQFLKQ